MAVRAGAKEARQVDAIAGRKAGQTRRQLQLGLRRRQSQRARAQIGGDVCEQLVDTGDSKCSQHPRPIVGGVRSVGHRQSARRCQLVATSQLRQLDEVSSS